MVRNNIALLPLSHSATPPHTTRAHTPQGAFYLVDRIDGYRRLFDVNDTSLAHPYAVKERVPVWLLGVLCAIVPAVIIVLTA